MRQPYKLAKFRWDCGGREVVGVKVEFPKVTQTEETAVRVEKPIKPTVAQVQANHLTILWIACDPIPGTTITIYLPRLHLWIRTIIVIRVIIVTIVLRIFSIHSLFNKFLP